MMNANNPIIQMTESAVQHVQKILEKKESGSKFRLSVKETGCSGLMYVPEVVMEVKPTDIEVLINQNLTLYLDQEALESVRGTLIDLKSQSLGQLQLVYNNPNAEGLCGCGESFNLKKPEEAE